MAPKEQNVIHTVFLYKDGLTLKLSGVLRLDIMLRTLL